jgi:hypothetical protein
MTSRSAAATIAMGLLLTAALGGLVVGIPLLASSVARTSLVPLAILAYGLASLAGAIGVSRPTRWALPLVVLSQGVAVGALLSTFATIAREGSLLAVAAVAGGALVATVADNLVPSSR